MNPAVSACKAFGFLNCLVVYAAPLGVDDGRLTIAMTQCLMVLRKEDNWGLWTVVDGYLIFGRGNGPGTVIPVPGDVEPHRLRHLINI
jgi:hypothetical protein